MHYRDYNDFISRFCYGEDVKNCGGFTTPDLMCAMLHILFCNYATYTGNSGVHIHFLANALTQQGVKCTVSLPVLPKNRTYFGPIEYTLETWLITLAKVLAGTKYDIIHTWTPREGVRILSKIICDISFIHRSQLIVHIEDNEPWLVSNSPIKQQYGFKRAVKFFTTSHPKHASNFVRSARANTCITESLQLFCAKNKPCHVIMPGCEPCFFSMPPPFCGLSGSATLRQKYAIAAGVTVICYAGAVHHYNQREMEELFLALPLVDSAGHSILCLHVGSLNIELKRPARDAYAQYVIHAPDVVAADIPNYVELADILVQPGFVGQFNDYRLPSKLPMYLASGRPVILPRTNLGNLLQNYKQCIHLTTGDSLDIAEKILFLLNNPVVAQNIGRMGREFASRNCNWNTAAQRLTNFYKTVLMKP